MTTSNIKACIPCDVHQVWEVVTEVAHYAWRSDLSKTVKQGEKQFIEYTKTGYATTFTITLTDPCRRWEFHMENPNMKGHWIGVFTQKGAQTEIQFTEDVTAKKLYLKPFVKAYCKRQQAQYVADLKKALGQ